MWDLNAKWPRLLLEFTWCPVLSGSEAMLSVWWLGPLSDMDLHSLVSRRKMVWKWHENIYRKPLDEGKINIAQLWPSSGPLGLGAAREDLHWLYILFLSKNIQLWPLSISTCKMKGSDLIHGSFHADNPWWRMWFRNQPITGVSRNTSF